MLYAAALGTGIISGEENAILTAIIIVSMMVTPLLIAALRLVERNIPLSTDGVERPENLSGNVLIIGFGRVGQIVSQVLLTRGHVISIIDTDVEMINTAHEFDFKVYYGDGKRLDILHAAGAERAMRSWSAWTRRTTPRKSSSSSRPSSLSSRFSRVPLTGGTRWIYHRGRRFPHP